jgi:hypothetical protein
MSMKLTDILIRHNEIEVIQDKSVIYKNGTVIPLTDYELSSLLTSFHIHDIGKDIPVYN